VSPELPLVRLVEDYVLRHRHRLFPVVRDGVLLGTVRTDRVAATPAEERARLQVGDIMEPMTPETAVAPETDAFDALARMRETGRRRLLVVSGRRLVGILSLSDLIGYLSLSSELRPPATGRRR
jgi:CBS domain-containing protein